ncbi:hypothetical protein DITRI_Ditri02bG0000900 [Diplodiscus trichospermus]
MEVLRIKLGFDCCLAVDCIGRAGGLALLWANDVNLEIKSYSISHIDAVIDDTHKNFKWRLTGFYGEPEAVRRVQSWNLLRQLNDAYDLPWLCIGDFNEILCNREKVEGVPRNETLMNNLREVVSECDFHELNVKGPKFTWSRGSGDNLILERLDRGLASRDWLDFFNFSWEQHIVTATSDHFLLLFRISEVGFWGAKRRKKSGLKLNN